MLINRETDYAIRILRVLSDGQARSIADLCETECIPAEMGSEIANRLQSAGYILVVEDGCQLAIDLHQLSLYDLIDGVNDDFPYLNDCLKPGQECEWKDSHDEGCRVCMKLASLQNSIASTLKAQSLYSVMFD